MFEVKWQGGNDSNAVDYFIDGEQLSYRDGGKGFNQISSGEREYDPTPQDLMLSNLTAFLIEKFDIPDVGDHTAQGKAQLYLDGHTKVMMYYDALDYFPYESPWDNLQEAWELKVPFIINTDLFKDALEAAGNEEWGLEAIIERVPYKQRIDLHLFDGAPEFLGEMLKIECEELLTQRLIREEAGIPYFSLLCSGRIYSDAIILNHVDGCKMIVQRDEKGIDIPLFEPKQLGLQERLRLFLKNLDKEGKQLLIKWNGGGDESIVEFFEDQDPIDHSWGLFGLLVDHLVQKLGIPSTGEHYQYGQGHIYFNEEEEFVIRYEISDSSYDSEEVIKGTMYYDDEMKGLISQTLHAISDGTGCMYVKKGKIECELKGISYMPFPERSKIEDKVKEFVLQEMLTFSNIFSHKEEISFEGIFYEDRMEMVFNGSDRLTAERKEDWKVEPLFAQH